MSNWTFDYHHAFLLRLLIMAVTVGILWPVLWLLAGLGRTVLRLMSAAGWHPKSAVER